MNDVHDSPLAHGLRLFIVLACAVGLSILLSGADAAFASPDRAEPVDPGGLVAGIGWGAAIVAAAMGMLAARIARPVASFAAMAGLVIVATGLAGGASVAPALALAAAVSRVSFVVLLFGLAVAVSAEASGRGARRTPVMAALGAVAIGIGVAQLLVYDPRLDPACVTGCRAGHPWVAIGPVAHLWLGRLLDIVTVVAGIGAIATGGPHVVARGARQIPLALTALGLSTLAVVSVVVAIEPYDLVAGDPSFQAGSAVVLLGTGGRAFLAVGLVWWGWTAVRLRVRLERTAAEFAAAPEPRRVAVGLGEALANGPVWATYPRSDPPGEIDADGRDAAADQDDGPRATPVLRHGERIATIHHAPNVGTAVLMAQLSPATLASLDIERLGAISLASLRQLRESRARIVAAQDAERRRVERDLHDGAQQHILAAAMDLRLATLAADRDGDRGTVAALRNAEGLAADALDELRLLARGVHPAILTQSGLGAALSSLAEETPVPVTLEIDRDARLPDLIEAIAYRSVAESIADAAHRGATDVAVTVRSGAGIVTVDIEFDGRAPGVPQRIVDRVGAAGGTVDIAAASSSRHRIRAVMPCV